MKELSIEEKAKRSIEEKAKRYDEAIEIARQYYNDRAMPIGTNFKLERMFPELKESEDERIRKYLKRVFGEWSYDDLFEKGFRKEDIMAWLEKQGEQKTIQEFEPTPIFRIGDILKKKGKDYTFRVDRIQGGYYHCDRNHGAFFPIEEQGNWELVEQKPAWSEEDEKMLSDIIKDLVHPWNEYIPDRIEDEIKWLKNKLKSLKPQNTWKPSGEHYELEEFAKIVRCNLTGISKAVQKLFEAKYLQLTGNKMYGGFKD